MHSRSEGSSGNGIGRHDRTIEPHPFQIILQHVKVDVHPVRDKAKPKVFTQGKEALQDIVVPGKLHWTTIAEVSNHAQSSVNRRF